MPKTMTGSALNISMEKPHSPETYGELWRDAFKLMRPVRLLGDTVGLIGSADMNLLDKGLIYGDLYKYFDLDKDRDWFNVSRKKAASKEEISSIQIPDELKPHFTYVPYVFDLNRHRLFFATKDGRDTITPIQVKSILSEVFAVEKIAKKYPVISVSHEVSKAELEALFKLEVISQFKMVFDNRPNPDDLDEYEAEMEELMAEENASRREVSIKSHSHQSLSLTEKTQRQAMVAKSNGHVEVWGRKAGNRVNEHYSTDDMPVQGQVSYHKNETRRGAFDRLVAVLAGLI